MRTLGVFCDSIARKQNQSHGPHAVKTNKCTESIINPERCQSPRGTYTPYEGLNLANQISRKFGVFDREFGGSHTKYV